MKTILFLILLSMLQLKAQDFTTFRVEVNYPNRGLVVQAYFPNGKSGGSINFTVPSTYGQSSTNTKKIYGKRLFIPTDTRNKDWSANYHFKAVYSKTDKTIRYTNRQGKVEDLPILVISTYK